MPACLTHISRIDALCNHSPAAEPQKLIVPFALADLLLGAVAAIDLATPGMASPWERLSDAANDFTM